MFHPRHRDWLFDQKISYRHQHAHEAGMWILHFCRVQPDNKTNKHLTNILAKCIHIKRYSADPVQYFFDKRVRRQTKIKYYLSNLFFNIMIYHIVLAWAFYRLYKKLDCIKTGGIKIC